MKYKYYAFNFQTNKMNYDFKANWNDIILPLLSFPIVKKSIKKGINSFLKEHSSNINGKYDAKKCPAEYETSDGWFMYMEDFNEKLEKELLETGYLKQPPIIDDNIDFDESPAYLDYIDYKDNLLEPFIRHHVRTSLRSYQFIHGCHWWNPTFSLTLAKIIYPNEKWSVKSGTYHTTIVNSTETLVFDIVYFDENDDTKGGKSAIKEANRN